MERVFDSQATIPGDMAQPVMPTPAVPGLAPTPVTAQQVIPTPAAPVVAQAPAVPGMAQQVIPTPAAPAMAQQVIPTPAAPSSATPLGSCPHRDRLSKLTLSGLVKEIAIVKTHPHWGQFIKENKVKPEEFGTLDAIEELVKFYQDAEEMEALAKALPAAPATAGHAPTPAVPGMAQQVIPTPAAPAMAQQVAPTPGVPGMAQQVIPTPAAPAMAQHVAPTPAVPETAQQVIPTPAAPVTAQQVATTPAVPETAQQVIPTAAAPVTAQQVAPTPAVPETAQQVIPTPATPADLAALQAMGWGIAKSCRPEPEAPAVAPETPPPAAAAANAPKLTAEALNAVATPEASQKTAFTPVVPKMEPVAPVQAPAQQQGGYSRRAAANLVKRLKESPGRLEGLPSLHQMVFDDKKKSDLIDLLVENSGSLDRVQAHLQFQEEKGRAECARRKAVRLTKKQMMDTYGDEAEKVMKYKEKMGLTEDDENNPGVKVYLVAQKEDESEDFHRTSILAEGLRKPEKNL